MVLSDISRLTLVLNHTAIKAMQVWVTRATDMYVQLEFFESVFTCATCFVCIVVGRYFEPLRVPVFSVVKMTFISTGMWCLSCTSVPVVYIAWTDVCWSVASLMRWLVTVLCMSRVDARGTKMACKFCTFVPFASLLKLIISHGIALCRCFSCTSCRQISSNW